MTRLTSLGLVGSFVVWVACVCGNVSAHHGSAGSAVRNASWTLPAWVDSQTLERARTALVAAQGQRTPIDKDGRRLFEAETFGGNGRTCLTCHSKGSGTVSPGYAQKLFTTHPDDPLFAHDGSDDGLGNGVTRMLADATILMRIEMHPDVRLANDPTARFVTVRRGVPSTLNTPALDPVLMLDGRQPNLPSQAASAIRDHAQATMNPTPQQLDRIAQFQRTDGFFSSIQLRNFAHGAAAPGLPRGRTAPERRGRRFFENLPPDLATLKDGLCATCHSGPLLNETNEFLPLPVPVGTRFQTVLVSEFNALGNPVQDFIFTDSTGTETPISSPDPGRALITGRTDDIGTTFDHVNAFKISSLRGIARTAPYFHDNSAKSLEDVVLHYREFFLAVTGGSIVLDDRDVADIVAFMKLLN